MREFADVGRRFPVGAEVIAGLGVHFRVWAPDHDRVSLVLPGVDGAAARGIPCDREEGGYHSILAAEVSAGAHYGFRLGEGEQLYPDPASRFQPDGPHGASQVIDAKAFEWTDVGWNGVRIAGQVFYEMHIGTFTKEGTWAAAARELAELRDTGITVVEVMPVAEFPGRFGWGYDGVDLFAPTRLYGVPDDFRRFVDQAHRLGLGVILDVVYNHVGPDGAYLKSFARAYFTDRYQNEWGEAINFDGEDSGPVREFFLANAACWIEEYHLDGLRLDATQSIHDASPEHFLAALARRTRTAAGRRSIVLVAENESQASRLAEPVEQGGYGLDALWNDDYQHSAAVAMTGRREAYYSDYLGAAQELVSAIKYGYLFQGQHYSWQKKSRGTPAWDLPPTAFVNCLENHDQVANSGSGRRMHELTSPGRYRALMALTLLGPASPLLFQGQEFGSSKPFQFFADHEPALAEAVRRGRFEFLAQFPSLGSEAVRPRFADPCSRETFEQCRLDFRERDAHRAAYDLTRDLLRLRRHDPAFRAQRRGGVDGAVLGTQAFVLRFFAPGGHDEDRLLIVNLGRDLPLKVAPEPLLAAPAGRAWTIAWSSDDPRYGGAGIPPLATDGEMRIPAEAALVLSAGTESRD